MWWSSSVLEEEEVTRAKEPWAFDKKISVTVAVLLVVQIFTSGWYVSSMDARLTGVEKAIVTNHGNDMEVQREYHLFLERVARIEEKVSTALEYIRDLKSKVDRTPAHGGAP
jgi:hypothetical protein